MDEPGWSDVADGWARWWGGVARPAQEQLIEAAGIDRGSRVLDVGCGSGEFLSLLIERGAEASGIDPAEGMRRLAAATGADVRAGDAENIPYPEATFDVVTAINALWFADDTTAALRECARVLRTGGHVAVAGWAEKSHNDLDALEHAVALADESESPLDGPLRFAGGIEDAMSAAGLRVAASGIITVSWLAADDDALVRGVLLGEDEGFIDEMRPVVVEAAAPFRDGGGYRLVNAFRWAVAVRD